MERLGGEGTGQTSSIRQVALASFIGTAIEWYDFFLYGTAAALVFGKLFFPEATPLQGTLLAFGTYGVGFFARPVGGIIFGHYGDRIGRKTMLVLSLLIMGVATFLIGLLPTFEQVGVLAPILLVVLRLFQGIGVGGEWGGAVLMAVEHAPPGRRGFYGSWPQMGPAVGFRPDARHGQGVRAFGDLRRSHGRQHAPLPGGRDPSGGRDLRPVPDECTGRRCTSETRAPWA